MDWDDALDEHRSRYRERIIDAAIDLVAEQGAVKSSMSALAQRAGVGRATVYKYFPSIEHALLAHVEREVKECSRRLEAICEQTGDPLQRLRGYVDTQLDLFAGQRHRLSWSTIDQADLSAAALSSFREHVERLQAPLVEILRGGVTHGAFRPDIDPELHARIIIKVLGSLREDIILEKLSPATAAEAVWKLITGGLLAPVDSSR
ncbi:TetR/AcrR family transcriptional regulator [Nonomuraea sp. NPDC050786]|uniref:TetR/AcrR family transcriptional regulator n=1 Tax=Nonomuraea sp. NPDC050786 TaxID=3154840 RepID=UPI0034115852